ncbi:hypothetical protein GLOIN_2v1847779 [Rhizophagus clarus]|uniref:Uncharacterized protein n=1 Tax=Rhizophagus clarus TaxID=94130 RepID=A0A8H3LDT1_9GLOM|nr:hypothetical protein GLOIN_2v1847779 [Rhizophagus clarus]
MPQSPLSDHEVLNNLIKLQVPITCDYFQKTSNEELILVNDENTQHSFFHNYPSNPYIHAVRVFSGKNYSQSYKIVSLGQYPTKVIYTRKEKGINYKVPNNYQVETILNGLTVLCKTQYQFSRKIVVKYTVEWTNENGQIKSRYSLSSAGAAGSLFLKEICNKLNSRVSGTILFGLDIGFLQQICEIIASQPQQSIMPANRKRYFTELTSQSQKNKRISMVGKEIATQTLTILKENKFTSPSEEIIASLETIIFKINGEIVELNFHSDNITDFTQYLDSIIRACNETLISRDSYYRLAKAVPNLIREHVIEKRRNEITKTMNILIPIKLFNIHSINFNDVNNENQQDIDGIEFNDDDADKINIKLSGDGRNVGRKQKHVMLTMCILNEEEAVLSPAHQYSICLYLGKESYNSLSTVSAKFSYELEQLKTNGYKDSNNTIWPVELFFSAKFSYELEQLKTNGYKDSNNTIWPVELFFSGNWKFVALVLGINAATSNYFCLYCNCHKDKRYNMDKVWLNSKNTHGCKNTMLFQEIDQNNWIIDELHLMLQISDVLFQCLFYELIKKKDFANNTQILIIAEMKRLHIHFEFYPPTTKNGKWEWTSLMGPDKEKILKDFQIRHLFDEQQATRGQDIEHLLSSL